MVTSIIKPGKPEPMLVTGQLIAFDLGKQYSCRFNQQNLREPSLLRPADYCDGQKSVHYRLDDTTGNKGGADPPCTGETPMEVLAPVSWPKGFASAATFLSVDVVNQKKCNHWFARNILLGGMNYQIDVWTDVAQGFPCQVSAQEQVDGGLTTTWAFDGFNNVIPWNNVAACYTPKIQCAQKDWECHPKKAATPQAIGTALGWLCGNMDCSPINPGFLFIFNTFCHNFSIVDGPLGGAHYEPNTLNDHANWAFTQYFRVWKMSQGYGACDFNGVAELVPPNSTVTEKIQKRTEGNDLLWGPNFICQ